jgi:hypothetical protein
MKPFIPFFAALFLATPAMAQTTLSPVLPAPCAVAAVATGGTAVTAMSGPANGFTLQNTQASAALFYNLSGVATTTAGGGNFSLAAGAQFTFPGQLASGFALSVNAAAAVPFACTRW